ncbi:hypothetical protein CJD44_25165 [Streptomyces sp. alain-838]|nr:hypothetical protein CJD44_25165 [Streptomyces sp. alain-838]
MQRRHCSAGAARSAVLCCMTYVPRAPRRSSPGPRWWVTGGQFGDRTVLPWGVGAGSGTALRRGCAVLGVTCQ